MNHINQERINCDMNTLSIEKVWYSKRMYPWPLKQEEFTDYQRYPVMNDRV